jgi:hypothetical protein
MSETPFSSAFGDAFPASPATAFVSVEDVKLSLGLGAYDTVDDEWLALVVRAVNLLVSQMRPDATSGDDRVRLGATMLAQRLYARRNAGEVAAFAEFGGPPPTVDRDIEFLLEVNRGFRPVVA